MENKTIIFSQKQLDEIIGKETVSEVDGGNAAYLDNITNDFVKNGNNEVYTGEKMDKTDAKPLYTDKYAKQRSLDYGPWMPDGRGGSKGSLDYTNHMITCSKKEWTAKNVVNEINSNLASNTYGDSKNRVSHNNASVLKARYHAAQTKAKSTDPTIRQQGITTMKNMERNNPNITQIESQYNNAMKVDKNIKDTESKVMGKENVYQKKGGTKTTGNGKAHTTKNGGIITYNN